MSKRVADVLIETLQAAGVKRCYGIVGDTLNRIAHAIDASEIEWVHVRHEEAGAFAAGAEAQLTGDLTACAGSCGPGSLHFINGLYEAHRNRAPVVLIATQIVRKDLGFQSIQEIDFNDVFKGCSVYCEMIVTPEQARRKAVAACQAALTKRGVAVLVVPADIANAAAADELPYAVHARRPLVRPSDADLDEIATILNKSEAITIYAGAGCADAHDEVVATAARLKAPMAHTSRGKDFVEYDNPYNVGMTGIIGGPAGYHAVLDCDVLLLLGADFAWPQFYPDRATIIQIDADPTHIGRRHPVAIGAVGDIKTTLQALLPRLDQHESGRFLAAHVKRHQADVAAAKAETVSGPEAAISGTWLTQIVNKHAAADALFAADDGTAAVWMLRHVDTGGRRRTFGSLLHGTMASGMPSALGLQKCQPGRQVICLAGDGGFSMLLGELLTVVQEKVPIKIVVYDNGKLGFIDIEQKAAGLVPVYTDLLNPDFGAVAKAMGLWGRHVARAGELEEAVKAWLAEPGPALLDVKVKPMQLVTPPSPFVSPEAVVGMAVYSAKAMLQGKGHDVWEMMVENIP
jgi:pyruvate dehydrogenase (quinone)